MNFKEVNLKLANMRKEQGFIIQDVNNSELFVIQSDKSIGSFNKETGKGKLNTSGKYFPHLAYAKPCDLTQEQLQKCLNALSVKGDILGSVNGSEIIYGGITLF